MSARAAVISGVLILAGSGCAATQDAGTAPPPMPVALAARLEPVLDAVWSGFDRDAALAHVEFATQYWRLAGNTGYNAYLDRIRARLDESSFVGSIRVDEYPLDTPAWDYTVGTLAIVLEDGGEEVVLSRERHRVALGINSFSTPPGGVLARLVDAGRGDRAEDYAGTDVKGAVVLGDASLGALWRRAVVAGGAIGVVSTSLGSYISPDPPGAPPTPRDQWDILQWGSIPYDEAVRGFGFKASPRAAASLRRALAEAGGAPVQVRATVASTFTAAPARTLVAEIPGRQAPGERVVIAAHLQEPGANDNASGPATLVEMARALSDGIRAGRVPPPARTLTFLWLDEIDGSRRWMADRPEEAAGVRYMFSMDMTGEDTAKTGGTFLIERWPDPGAVWDRPWDPHSEWGRGDVSAESLTGDLINDLHVAVCRRVAARTGWDVRTNPYEGGSDHTVFGRAGVPSVLNWHFTDRYYHSSFDTADKTSADEMRNVGVSVAGSSWVLASADDALAVAVGRLVADAGRARIELETREGAALAGADPDLDAARQREATILAAWRRWYREAVESVSRLVVGAPSDTLQAEIQALAAAFGG
jgi:hypothetical protein